MIHLAQRQARLEAGEEEEEDEQEEEGEETKEAGGESDLPYKPPLPTSLHKL